MRVCGKIFLTALMILVFGPLYSCDGDDNGDGGTDVDSDVDANGDGDSDIDGDIDVDGDSDSDGDAYSDADRDSGGLNIVTLTTNSPSITEGETVTITATVTHPKGTDFVAGGSLTTADGSNVYGPFILEGGSTFSIGIDWNQIHEFEPIEFDDETIRIFQAEFFDTFANRTTRTIDLELNCDGMASCNGVCKDLNTDAENCGECGRVCIRRGPTYLVGGCDGGNCLPTVSECFLVDEFSNCSEYCTSIGEECSREGCTGDTGWFYLSMSQCEKASWEYTRDGPCDQIFNRDTAYSARCCCTVTL